MNILLTGANGFIGQHLVRALLNEQHQVWVCCRHPEPLLRQFPQLHALKMEFAQAIDPEDWLAHLAGIDAVINTVGIIKATSAGSFEALQHLAPSALFKACAQMGIKKVVQFSALGATLSSSTDYFRTKAQADALLQTLELDWFIFKPSLVFGKGAKSLGLLTALAALPVSPLLDCGTQYLQPVSVNDLQQAVLISLKPLTPGRQLIAAVGPQAISCAELMRCLANYLGRSVRFWSMSKPSLNSLLLFARCLDEPVLSQQSMTMLQGGNTANADQFATFLGRNPESLDSYLHIASASQAERWHALIFFSATSQSQYCLGLAVDHLGVGLGISGHTKLSIT